MYFLGNSTPGQMMGFVFITEGFCVVVDGGTQGDWKQLDDLLREKSVKKVDAWFLTHPHHDHIGAFSEICKNSACRYGRRCMVQKICITMRQQ